MSNEKESKVYIPPEAYVEVSIRPKSNSYLARSLDKGTKFPLLTVEDLEERFITPKEALRRLGFSHLLYVRQLLRKSELEGIKLKVGGGERWLALAESVERYSTRVVRKGSKRNYILRVLPEEEDKVRSLLDKGGVDYELEVAYTKGSKSKKVEEPSWARVVKNM